jgi:hypothetical protein
MDQKLMQTIARLRRSQSMNRDTQEVCHALEELLKSRTVDCPTCEARKRQTRERVARFRQRQLRVKELQE